jgi:hypothetical protein
MYSLIGFNILDKDIDFPPEIKKIIVKNPDVDHMDNYGEFTIEGVKRKCELIIIFTKSYPEVEAEGRKNDLFFFYILPVLIPIDTLDTYYPCNMVPDFLEKVGENTSYLIAPEEILADNFKEIVTKSDINSFPNPELLKNMIKEIIVIYVNYMECVPSTEGGLYKDWFRENSDMSDWASFLRYYDLFSIWQKKNWTRTRIQNMRKIMNSMFIEPL